MIRPAEFEKLIHLGGSKSNRKSDEVIGKTKADGAGACESIETMAPRHTKAISSTRASGIDIVELKLPSSYADLMTKIN